MEDFNLLVATSRGNESAAKKEIMVLLNKAGDPEALSEETSIVGLVVSKTSLDPLEAISRLRSLLTEKPELFRFTLKVVPVKKVVSSNIEDVKASFADARSEIGPGETFRITVNKRHSNLSTVEVIKAVAALIDNKVQLESPDKIVLIEIMGALTGISIIKPIYIFSVVKERFGS
jgi:tRNA acetyltransferase TAN1